MIAAILLAAAQAALPPTPARSDGLSIQANRTSATVPAAAMSLFEKDWVLMGWALKRHDRDRDTLLEPEEAAGAAAEFRSIADGDGDGRVSRLEYRQAREFIVARY